MKITRQIAADKIADYLHGNLGLRRISSPIVLPRQSDCIKRMK
jgi:hypothetical protein